MKIRPPYSASIALLVGLLAALTTACTEGVDGPDSAPASHSAPVGPPAPAPVDQPRPGRLNFEAVDHDFGTVDDTRSLRWEFPFVNDGVAAVHVEGVKASCGCTTAELSQTDYAPGEGDVVVVNWKPKGFGPQSQTVHVTTDSPSLRVVRLKVDAVVEPKVRAEPAAADFGNVPAGVPHSMQVLLRSSTPGIEVLDVRPSVETLQASFVSNDGSGAADLLGLVDVRLLPEVRRGGFASSFVLVNRVPADETGPERTYEMKVSVRASVHGAVKTDPNGFYVGVVPPAGSVNYPLRLRRPDGGEFGLLRSEVLNCTVEALILEAETGTDAEGFYLDLSLRGDVGDYLGALRGQTLVHTDIEGDTPFNLPIMGMVRD